MNIESHTKKLVTHNLNAERRKRFASILGLCIWAAAQYSLGNKFYAIFIVVFSLVLILLGPRYFILLAVSVLVIVLFEIPTLDTLVSLKQSNLMATEDLALTLTNIVRANSGQEVLPIQVQHMLSLMDAQDISSYRLSEELGSNDLIRQRITEAAWPITMSDMSPYLLITLDEMSSNSKCVLIDQRKDVVLAYCN